MPKRQTMASSVSGRFFLVPDQQDVYTFLIGDDRCELHPGDYAFVPRGTVHAFTNTGAAPPRLLVLVTLGGIHEQFFIEAGERITDPANPPDGPRLIAIVAKYGIVILPPPGA